VEWSGVHAYLLDVGRLGSRRKGRPFDFLLLLLEKEKALLF
jgi:hypothetical protein